MERDGLEDGRDFVVAVGAATVDAEAQIDLGEGRELDYFFRHVRAAGTSSETEAPAAEVLASETEVAPLTLHEDLREEDPSVRRARNADACVRELLVQNVLAMLIRDHPTLDREGRRV